MKRNLSECTSNQKVEIEDLESDWMTPRTNEDYEVSGFSLRAANAMD